MFEIAYTKKKLNANTLKFNGKHPYVTRQAGNNGIRGYIDHDEQFLNDANTISFGMDTAVMFYQSKPYFTGDKIKVFYPRIDFNTTIAMYVITAMKRSFSLFGWGMSYDNSIISNVALQLPKGKDGKPDFEYMTAYIRQIEIERLDELGRYAETRLKAMCHVVDDNPYI
ncbi:MAG: restriction endonuclease subunit S [Defluviitaleaceae bacterium]|nr:restriction endonuclease subunit S [Defluviitaleaceae bacterium]